MMTRREILMGTLLGGLLLVGSALGILGSRFDREIQNYVADLRTDAEAAPGGVYRKSDVADLPTPVKTYFETVLEDGQPLVELVRLEQSGDFRMGGPDGDWRPFSAVQHCSGDPPGFVWDAQIEVAPLLPARVLDCYVRGSGILRARLRGVIPVASEGPSPEMDEGELLRYLAEVVWYPTALLPQRGVEWESVDTSTARAIVRDGDVSASLVFHFDDDGFVERVEGERYRQEDDSYATWIGYFSDYQERNGRLIPLSGEVAWDLPAGESSYWRGTITEIEHSDSAAEA